MHQNFGEGVVYAVRHSHYKVTFLGKGVIEIGCSDSMFHVIESIDEDCKTTVEEVEEVLRSLLERAGVLHENVSLGDRWKKGKMLLVPFDSSLSHKELMIEDFFHKITMLRDRLRVLEQKINSHSKLEESEKLEMQQYITKCYGSLTTFNVLFRHKEDHFVGQKGD